jgi:hypothetical protein
MNIVTRHLLIRADCRLAAEAAIAAAARDHRWDYNCTISVPKSIYASVNDMAADLMPKCQRKFMLGTHTIVIVTKISVADSASGDFHHDFIRGWGFNIEFRRDKRLACARHHPTNRLSAHPPASSFTP